MWMWSDYVPKPSFMDTNLNFMCLLIMTYYLSLHFFSTFKNVKMILSSQAVCTKPGFALYTGQFANLCLPITSFHHILDKLLCAWCGWFTHRFFDEVSGTSFLPQSNSYCRPTLCLGCSRYSGFKSACPQGNLYFPGLGRRIYRLGFSTCFPELGSVLASLGGSASLPYWAAEPEHRSPSISWKGTAWHAWLMPWDSFSSKFSTRSSAKKLKWIK
jgi:hypothetical protein